MWIPFLHKYHRSVCEERTLSALMVRVVVPGAMVLYLIATEQEFLRAFQESVPIMLGGEIAFIVLHVALTYALLPMTWFFDLLDFFMDENHALDILATLYRLCAQILFWLLLVAIVVRVWFE